MSWPGSRERQKMNNRSRIALVTTLTGLVLIGGIYLDFVGRVQDERARLVQRGERQARSFSTATTGALETIEGLRTFAEARLARAQSVISEYGHLLGPIPDKGGYGLIELTPPPDPAASLNLTGLGSLQDDTALKAELEVALSLDEMFRWVKRVYPEAPWVYYLSARRFMCVYPYIPFDDFFMDEAFYDMDLFVRGTPERNPERAPYVTEVYLDEAGQGLMVTFGAPVYQDGSFRGIVGFDLTLQALHGFLQKYRLLGDRHYVVDRDGELIVVAEDDASEPVNDREPFSALRPGLFALARRHADTGHAVAFEGAQVSSLPLAGVPWMLITERSDLSIYRSAARGTLPLIALIAVLLSGIALFTRERQRQKHFSAERSTRRFRHLLDSSSDMIAVVDPASARFLDANQAACELLGLPREEMLAKRVFDFSGMLNSMELWQQTVAELREHGRFASEDRLERADGRAVVVDVNAHYAEDEEGEYIVGILRDISERKQAEAALQKANQRFISVLEGIDASVYVADMQTYEVLYLNPKLRERVGEVVGKTCWESVYPGHTRPCNFCNNDRLLNARGQPAGTCTWESRDDVDGAWYRYSARAIPWDDGRYVRLEIAFDITEVKRAEAERERLQRELWQSQKMEAIGQLTGGIAHDFNNILASILGLAELARDRFGADDAGLDDYLEQIVRASGRARGLVRQLLVYSRGDSKATAQPLLVARQVKDVLDLLRPMLPATIEIHTDLPETSPIVTVDPLHLQQLLMNLSINARDAMKGSGVLSVAVTVERLDGAECRICHEQVRGEWVCIRVADSGPGIPPEMLDRMFQPFFTTKEVGDGGGMGLAVVQGIVKTYGGHILVDTAPGRGSSFAILLPPTALPSREGLAAGGVGEAVLDLRGKRLLVVEDEPIVRRYLKELLCGAGADVVACADAAEALEAFRPS
ncbi:MAG: PAS domain S-box protein, partial [Gammaproteobacteria bacterium]